MENSDLEIAKAILCRDQKVTVEFLYKRSYPLFKALYDRYDTDCSNVVEFIHEIYSYVLTPGGKSKVCPLQAYQGKGSLFSWFKVVSLSYCYARFRKKAVFEVADIDISDIYDKALPSLSLDMSQIEDMDFKRILCLMPNKRYSKLLRMRYIENRSHEEIAEELGMTMSNYYNKHKLAKEQFIKVYNKDLGNE